MCHMMSALFAKFELYFFRVYGVHDAAKNARSAQVNDCTRMATMLLASKKGFGGPLLKEMCLTVAMALAALPWPSMCPAVHYNHTAAVLASAGLKHCVRAVSYVQNCGVFLPCQSFCSFFFATYINAMW